MKIDIDKKVLRYFFVLTTIAILFPPFYVNFGSYNTQFSFLLHPPRNAEGVVISLLTVEIVASFLIANIINFVISNTPKKYLYGIPIFLILLVVFWFAYEEYERHLRKEEAIMSGIEKSKQRINHKDVVECSHILEKDKVEAQEHYKKTGLRPHLTNSFLKFRNLGCSKKFPYIFGESPLITINKDTTFIEIKKAHNAYIKNIEHKFRSDMLLTIEEEFFTCYPNLYC